MLWYWPKMQVENGLMWSGHSCPLAGSRYLAQRTRVSAPHELGRQTTSSFSPTNFLSFSSVPVSSNEFVSVALPLSTRVITEEHPNQWASARSVGDHCAGWSGWE